MRIMLLTLLATLVAGMRYDGYHVVEFTPKTKSEVSTMESLFRDAEIIPYDEIRRVFLNRLQEILVPPNRQDVFAHLDSANISYTIIHYDYQQHVNEIWEDAKSRGYERQQFNTLSDITQRLEKLMHDCPSQWQCKIENLATTEEGRFLHAYELTPPSPECNIFVEGGARANQWITVSTAVETIEHLHSTKQMDRYGWVLIPVFNPDGYEYTWTTDRNWLKNRRYNQAWPACVGVDLNRNFDWEWGGAGGSHNPCSYTYIGPYVASEPEVEAMQRYVSDWYQNSTCMRAFISLHTYGGSWVHPFGTEASPGVCRLAPNHDFLFDASQQMAAASANVDHSDYNNWEYGNSCEVSYPESGSSTDFAMSISGGDIYAYTAKLRGRSFIVDSEEIPTAFDEFWAGIIALDDYIQSHPLN